MDTIENFNSRISELEKFKHDLEKKLYAAIAVASVLGIIGFLGGVWLKNVTDKLQTLTDRTVLLEKNLEIWDTEVKTSMDVLSNKKLILVKEFEENFSISLAGFRSEIENVADVKIKEISNIKIDQILQRLKNGTETLKLSGLSILNKEGVDAIAIYPDGGGDGYLRINSEDGKVRYLLSLENDRPQSNYYDINNNLSLSLGIFNDSNTSYVRLWNDSGEKIAIDMDSYSKGGRFQLYSNNGNQIVYIGPERNTGNGLVNVHNTEGSKTNSQSP
ncbi:hypothetical protein [uncultured Methylophaga sp.]|uniref:hypothetical protein n=1 Tax=uncultured Methylophaga sp. TaxID=285271 RepID=UPI002631DD7C|nr:hypothetical protein [uncultured Methylophaga sp.]|tara:strand:- start:79 stop:900 length:822 start_codon:yes stop_codon:yes gene_type:complete